MWSPHDLGVGGGVNQLMLQAGRWEKVWRGGKVQVVCAERPEIMGACPQIMGACPHFERAPLNNRGAPSFCGRFGDFLFFFMQLRVDDL
jgi:hypothetical protein